MPYYPFPSPRAYRLNKFLFDAVWNRELERRLESDREGIAKEYGLNEHEVKACMDKDVHRLAELGAHALLAALYALPHTIYKDKENLEFY